MLPFFSKTIFYLYEGLQGRNTLSQYAHFLETQWYTKDKLREYQFYRLKSLLEHSYQNVPYYTQLFDDYGFKPFKMNSFSDFKRLPFLTKDIIRDNTDNLIAKGIDKNRLLRLKTSGTTGQPLLVYAGNKRRSAGMAARLRMFSWWGADIWDKRVRLRGLPARFSSKERINIFLTYLMNIRILNAFDMTEKNMERYANIIKKFRPKVLIGYLDAIYILARFIRKRKIKLDHASLKVIFSEADTLFDFQKKIIQDAFGCQVTTNYGAMEGGSIAMECPQRNMHILSDNVFLELVKGEKEALLGEEGEVVVTNFYNYAMPIIRYKQDDVATFSDAGCSCGRTFPVMKSLKGRKIDFIVLPGGRLIHGTAFIWILSEQRGVEFFKIVQKEIGKIIIIIERSEYFNDTTLDIIRKKINERCGGKLKVDFILTDKIDTIYRGEKRRFIASEVAKDYF